MSLARVDNDKEWAFDQLTVISTTNVVRHQPVAEALHASIPCFMRKFSDLVDLPKNYSGH